jgi:hypothetical protein
MKLSDYREMLDYIETHAPEHSDLERLQSKGPTLINSILISKIYAALLELNALKSQETVQPTNLDDNIIRSYDGQLKKLFNQRARISNTFHISAGAHEDQQIADQVIEVQKEIAKVMADKAFYIEKKQLPPIEDMDEVFYIPTNPIKLMRKLESTATSLYKRNRELKAIDQIKEPSKYAKKQATIERLSKYKLYLEQERNQINQSAGV